MTKFNYGLLAVLTSMLSLQAAHKVTIRTSPTSDNSIDIAITIPLQPGQYIYADQIQLSVNSPSITLSPYKSSVEPIIKYDSTFKENRRIIEQSPVLRLTATKKDTDNLPHADLRIVYYINKNKTAFEQLFPLSFKDEPQTIVPDQNQSVQEQIPNEQPQAPVVQTHETTSSSWIDYLKNIAKTSQLLWIRILIVFILGLLMSLTPCIYPMIPITIGILQAQGAPSMWRNFSLSIAYTMGLGTTFALFGLAAALAGHAFGSFMNHPIVILLIVILMIYNALSLFGLYEIHIPQFLKNTQGAKGGSFVAAFLFGAISGTIASPCLSPGLLFMLTLVATLKNIFAGFILLYSFAIGLSIPLLIIGTFSGSLNLLPRAGAWMIEIKYLLGFMLIAMCFYFLGSILPLFLLLALFAIFLATMGIFYLYHARNIRGLWRNISNLLGMAAIALSVFVSAKAIQIFAIKPEPVQQTISWRTDYQQAVTQAIKDNSQLFIFVHAPRCAACVIMEQQLNKSSRALQALKKLVTLEIDLSKQSDQSTNIVSSRFEILGAPAFLLIDAQSQAIIKRWDGELDETQFEEMVKTLEMH